MSELDRKMSSVFEMYAALTDEERVDFHKTLNASMITVEQAKEGMRQLFKALSRYE